MTPISSLGDNWGERNDHLKPRFTHVRSRSFLRRVTVYHHRDHLHHDLHIWSTWFMHRGSHGWRLDNRGRSCGLTGPSSLSLPSHGLPTWVLEFLDLLSRLLPCVLPEELAIIWFMCGCTLTRGRKRESWRGRDCGRERGCERKR